MGSLNGNVVVVFCRFVIIAFMLVRPRFIYSAMLAVFHFLFYFVFRLACHNGSNLACNRDGLEALNVEYAFQVVLLHFCLVGFAAQAGYRFERVRFQELCLILP